MGGKYLICDLARERSPSSIKFNCLLSLNLGILEICLSLAVSVNLQMELHKLKKPMRTKSDVQAALREQVMFFFSVISRQSAYLSFA